MNQLSFADTEHPTKHPKRRGEVFLGEREQVVPWHYAAHQYGTGLFLQAQRIFPAFCYSLPCRAEAICNTSSVHFTDLPTINTSDDNRVMTTNEKAE